MSEIHVASGAPDWFSRFMSLGSLAVAGAALFYAYRGQTNTERQTAFKPDVTQQANLTPGQPRAEDADSGSYENDAALGDGEVASNGIDTENRMNDSGDTTVEPQANRDILADRNTIDWGDQPQEETNQPNDATNEPLDASDLVTPGLAAGGSATSNRAEPDREPDLGTPVNEPANRAPRLVEVRKTLRPTGDADSVTTVLNNAGDEVAEIIEVRFQPSEVVQLEESAGTPAWTGPDRDNLVLYFTDEHNRTTTNGKHGAYVRKLFTPFLVDPDSYSNINLAIRNDGHLGWGLQGTLSVRLANGDDLEVDDVTLAFVE